MRDFQIFFVDYPLGEMRVGDKLWTNRNKSPLKLWQTQLNFEVSCQLSACRVSSEHLNYKKHPMVRSLSTSRVLSCEKDFKKTTGSTTA